MLEIVIATRNLHKLRELRLIGKNIAKVDWLSIINFPNYQPPKEVGSTFEENATLKALHAAQELNCWVLADDSGLVVPALQGAPGIYSHRYAGEQATDADNRKKILEQLQGISDLEQRQAYFQCSLALAGPNGLKRCVLGTCEGFLLLEERGNSGFGYDPLFVKHDYDKSFAELEESVKNRISHRYKAFEKLIPTLEAL